MLPRPSVRRDARRTSIVERALQARRAVGRGEGSARARARSRSPADSSSGCASRARSPRRRRCCCSTSRRRRSIRSARRRSRSSSTSCAQTMTIIIVTHNMQQAARVSDRTVFMLARRDGRVRADERDVHRAARSAHRSVHHRTVRMTAVAADRTPIRRRVGARAVASSAESFSFWYGEKQALFDITLAARAAQRHGAHRAVGLRQVHVPALDQPHERAAARAPVIEGAIRLDGEDIYQRRMDAVSLRQRVGMVFQRWNPFPKSIYDNVAYGPRINGDSQPLGSRRDRRVGAAARGAVGRSEGSSARERARPVRRTAAAAVHRARAGERAGSAAARRAGERARSDRDAEGRGAAVRAQARADDRHRHAQPAAGGARLGHDRVLLPRTTRRGRADRHGMFTSPREERTEAYITGRFG